jgi:hypothetical protein
VVVFDILQIPNRTDPSVQPKQWKRGVSGGGDGCIQGFSGET